MALNNSGPLSFGGSTTGQSINLELGVSATALASINSTAFRNLAGVASGQISLSNFYGKSSVTYYIIGVTASGGASTPWYDNQMYDIDGSGNHYIILNSNQPMSIVVKTTATGGSVTCYGASLSNTSGGTFSYEQTLAVASNGNLTHGGYIYQQTVVPGSYSTYTSGQRTSFVTSGSQSTIGTGLKYTPTVWGVSTTYSSMNSGYMGSSVDSSGNYYTRINGANYYFYGYDCCGNPIYDMKGQAMFLAKFSSGGSLSSLLLVSQDSGYSYVYPGQTMVMASGGIMISGPQGSPGPGALGANMQCLTLLNSAMSAITWTKYFYTMAPWGRGAEEYAYVSRDSSDNSYLTYPAYYQPVNNGGTVLWKIDSSGTVQWVKGFTIAGVGIAPRGSCSDSAGNTYIVGAANTGSGYQTYVWKVNSSGVLQWGTLISCATSGKQMNGRVPRVMPDGSIAVYIPTYPDWSPHFFITLPAAGGKTGTFVNSGCTIVLSNLTVVAYDVSTYSTSNRTNSGFGTTGQTGTFSVGASYSTPTATVSATVI